MSKSKESILCDGCGKELITNSMYPHNFNLELKIIDTERQQCGVKYCLAQFPLFEGSKHFCGNECLTKWMQKGKI